MKEIISKISIFIIVFIACTFSLFSQKVDEAAFDKYLSDAVKLYELPGLSISVTDEQNVLFSKAYGVRNREEKSKVDTRSVFAIASLSKAFTAAALGILVDDGKINWDDKVVKFLPDFKLIDTNVSNNITIEDLLSHRSGFITFDGDLLWYGTNYSRSEIISRFANREMTYDFRAEYGYQNIMFIIAGEIIPAVSGVSWEDFVKKRIFEPLQMTSSYTSITEFPETINIAEPHVKGVLDEIRNYDNSGGAAAINSNVEDLSKWIQMWLNEGIVNGDTIISPATVEELLNLNTPIDPSSFDRKNGIDFEGYAMGWFVMEYDGEKVAHHGGGLPGYISKIFIVPSKKLGGIILSNGETALPAAMMYKCLDTFLPTESNTDWATLYHGFSEGYQNRLLEKQKEIDLERKTETQPTYKLSEYVGNYYDKVYGEAKIVMKEGKLFLSLTPSKELFSSKLSHWQDDSFEIKFRDQFLPRGFINFQSKNGEVSGFTIDLPNPDFHFYKLDFKRKQ